MRRYWPTISFFVVFILLIVLHETSGLRFLENLSTSVLSPGQSIAFETGTKLRTRLQERDEEKLRQDHAQTQTRLTELEIENARLQSLIDDSAILKQERTFLEEQQLTGVSAKIFGVSDLNGTDVFILNKGTQHGVTLGAPVIVGEGLLIGKIVNVDETRSYLMLITEDNSSIGAVILNATHSPGLVQGSRGLSLSMELIPQGETIDVNDYVITSGIEKGVPQGLVIGQIDVVSKEESALFQRATIKLLQPLDRFSVVNIITSTSL